MKDTVKRENLKNNFLKNIIVRFDYTGIAEVELDNIVAKVKSIFKKAHYNNLKEEYLTEMDLQLQDPEGIEMESLPVTGVRKKRAYVFLIRKEGLNVNFQLSLRLYRFKVKNIFLFPNIAAHWLRW